MTKIGLLILANRPASELVKTARLADEEGFDCVWVPDERFFRDCFSLLALVSQATRRVSIGPCVVDPYTRHPALTAVALATIDEMSAGRAVCAIGAGRSGFQELGIKHVPPPVAAVRDAVSTIRRMLSMPGAPRGPALNFQTQGQDIRIVIAAEGPGMLRLAGELGDGVIIQAKPLAKPFLAALARVMRGRSETGRKGEFEVISRLDLCVAHSLADAYDALRHRVARRLIASSPKFEPLLAAGLLVPDSLREMVTGVSYTNDHAVLSRIGRFVPDSFVDAFCVAATTRDLAQRLDGVASVGANQIIINPIAAPGIGVNELTRLVGQWHRQRH